MTAIGEVVSGSKGLRAWLLALPAALAASVIALLLAGQLMNLQPIWLAFSVHSAVIAAVWMCAGGYVAPRTPVGLALVFIPGAVAAWYVHIGIPLFERGPYDGLIHFVAACMAAGAVWWMYARQTGGTGRRIAVVLPLAAIVLPVTWHLATIIPGVGIQLTAPDGRVLRVQTVNEGQRTAGTSPVWVRDAAFGSGGRDTITVRLETGSSDAPVTLRRISEPAERQRACSALWRETERLVVAGAVQVVPRAVTYLSYRQSACGGGSFWSIAR
jgi:hypothetical protein